MSSTSVTGLVGPNIFFVNRFNRLMNTLERSFQTICPQYGAEGFKERVFDRLTEHSKNLPNFYVSLDGTINEEKLAEALLGDSSDVWFIYCACAFAIEVGHALVKGNHDCAWCLMTDAYFYLGVVTVVTGGEEMNVLAVKRALDSERARKAAEARHKKTNEMKTWAYEYVKTKNTWRNQAHAVLDIESQLKAQFKDRPLKNYEETITSWLQEMEDREKYFPTVGANRLGRTDPST